MGEKDAKACEDVINFLLEENKKLKDRVFELEILLKLIGDMTKGILRTDLMEVLEKKREK